MQNRLEGSKVFMTGVNSHIGFAIAAWEGVTPLKREDGGLARPEDIAETMIHLVNAARTTGEIVVVDGGFHRVQGLPAGQES